MSPKEFIYQVNKTDTATILKIGTALFCTLTFCFTSGMYYQGIMTELHSIKDVNKKVDENKREQDSLKSIVFIHSISILNNTTDINFLKETILYGTTPQLKK